MKLLKFLARKHYSIGFLFSILFVSGISSSYAMGPRVHQVVQMKGQAFYEGEVVSEVEGEDRVNVRWKKINGQSLRMDESLSKYDINYEVKRFENFAVGQEVIASIKGQFFPLELKKLYNSGFAFVEVKYYSFSSKGGFNFDRNDFRSLLLSEQGNSVAKEYLKSGWNWYLHFVDLKTLEIFVPTEVEDRNGVQFKTGSIVKNKSGYVGKILQVFSKNKGEGESLVLVDFIKLGNSFDWHKKVVPVSNLESAPEVKQVPAKSRIRYGDPG